MNAKMRVPLFWQWTYILVNVFALLSMLLTGELMGDAQGLTLQSSARLVIAGVAVVVSYWFLLGPLFNLIGRLHVAPLRFGPNLDLVEDRMGLFLIGAQLLFMAFNILFGVNVAGSATARTESSLSLLWIALPVDSLFLIYYAAARQSRFFRLNFLIYVLSNVMRGWTGIFLFVIFLEMCRASRAGKIRWRTIAPIGVAVLIFYPVLLNIKWLLRGAAATDVSILDGVDGLLQSLTADDYLNIVVDGVMQIVGRLQITSSVEEVIRFCGQLHHAFDMHSFKPFWLEGLHGIVYDRLMFGENRPAIGVAFTSIGEFPGDFDIGSWNTNTGWVGWLFVLPLWFPVFVLYTVALFYLCLYLAKKLGMNELLRDLVWFACLVYVLPGWLGAFVGFVYSLFVFLLLKLSFSYLPKVTVFKGGSRGATACQ